ncbi:NAD-dependent epimerase/dehydratase family protein [Nanoarchaeota archaeon]
MKVLVTGHKGYIGSVLLPMLLERGHEVVGIDSDIFRRCTYGEPPVEVKSIEKDIRDVTEEDVAGFDAIIHLAGLSNDPLGDWRPNLTYEINWKASVKIAELAKKMRVPRFLFSSSCSTYGASGDKMIDESGTFNPVTPYGKSKVYVERDLSKMADENFTPVYLRNATVYGMSPRIRFDLVLNNLVAWAFTTQKIFMKSDGTPWRPIVHVADVCRAFIAAMEAPKELVHDKAFNVGINEDNYQISEVAEAVRDTVPDSYIEYAEGAGPDKRCYRVDCNLIKKTLKDFKPVWNAKKGAEELYEAYKKYGVSVDEFEGPKFKRIAHIEYLVENGILDENFRWITKEVNENEQCAVQVM